MPVPEGPDLKALGDRIMKDTGLQGSYGTYRQSANQINVYVYSFWKSTQVKYFIAERKLLAEDRRFRWDNFLTGMHAQGGFEQGGYRNLWALVVDLVCLGMLLWVVTGLVMWWSLPFARWWGWLAFGSGLAAFGLFIWRL